MIYLYRPSFGILRRLARELSRSVARLMPTGQTLSQRPHIRQLFYKKTEETGLPAANVLVYTLEGGASVIVRPSGTEPKIKAYYTTLGKDVAEAQAQKDTLAAALKPIFS